MGKSCGKFLWENLAGKSCGAGRRGKANLRKAVIGGNLTFGIGDGGPTNQDPAEENLVGKSCGKFLWENLAGKSCGAGRRGKANLRKAVIGGNLTFGIG